MLKVAIVTPQIDYYTDIEAVFYKHRQNDVFIDSLNYSIHQIVVNIEDFSITTDADVLIARSGLYHLVASKSKVPVVELKSPSMDLLRILSNCDRNKKTAICAAKTTIIDCDILSKIFNMEIEVIFMEDLDARKVAKEVIRRGCTAFIADYYSVKYIDDPNIEIIPFRVSKEAMNAAFTSAKAMAISSRVAQKGTFLYKALLECSNEGIIILNKDLTVNSVSASVSKLIGGFDQNVAGLNITDLKNIPAELMAVIKTEKESHDFIQTYGVTGQINLNVHKVLFYLKNEEAGWIITMQMIPDLKKIDKEFRKSIYLQCHNAKHTFCDIVGESSSTKKMIALAKKYSISNSTILIVGKSGTGKEILAQSIHNFSHRARGAFVAVNCAALHANLLESELFGYVDGAFTGAAKGGKPGYFELAHNGTIFLDEISEMSLALQSKLLRILQEKEVQRLGDVKVRAIDVRVIASTNKELSTMVEQGLFREDLFYRLNVLKINLPTLNQRRDDIPYIAKQYLRKNFPGKSIDNESIALLMQFNWKGNIRQLLNMCERLAVVSSGDKINKEDVHKMLLEEDHEINLHDADDNVDEVFLALKKFNNNRKLAAEHLNISRTTLWRRIKKYSAKLEID